jgi:hypothetical protein
MLSRLYANCFTENLMSIRVEEAFNDCFERLLAGESLESCLNSYPEYAAELDSMLRTTYDVKRRTYPIQPRPEFKYWARVRLQNVQQYGAYQQDRSKPASFNLRRNLTISLAALLVLVIASSGTVAASSDAMPDDALYGVKLVVEQAQISLSTSDTDKVELYARITEKRAQEIAVMASRGKDDKVIATTQLMNDQLRKLEENLLSLESEDTEGQPTVASAPAAASLPPVPSIDDVPSVKVVLTSSDLPPLPPGMNTPTIVSTESTETTDSSTAINNSAATGTGTGNKNPQSAKRSASIKKAREAIKNSTAKSLTILQNTLDKSSASTKSVLNNAINQTITNNKRIQQESLSGTVNTNQGTQNLNINTDEDTGDDDSTTPRSNKSNTNRLKNKNKLDTGTKIVK